MLLVALFSDGTGPIPALGTDSRSAADVADRRGPGAAGPGRTARQGDLPGRPRRGVRRLRRRVPVRRRRHHHRGQAGLHGDLDGRRHLQAHPALPVRHLHDDVQQPGDAAALPQADVLREVPRRPSPRPAVAPAGAHQHGHRDADPAGAVLLPRRLADGDRGVRDGLLPPRHPVGHPDGCAAGVERLHDLQRAVAVRRARPHRHRRHHQPVARRVVRRPGRAR